MKNSNSGQTLTEVLVAAIILGIIAVQSVQGYQQFNKGDVDIRESLIQASLSNSFSQMSSDPHLIEEMFLEQNASLKACLLRGECSKDWLILSYDREAQWAYSQSKVHFDYRALNEDLVELRMSYDSARRPTLIWISRYDYVNLEAKIVDLACKHPLVITGVDYATLRPLCMKPDPVQAKDRP